MSVPCRLGGCEDRPLCLVVPPDLLGLCCLVRKPSLTWCLLHERLQLIIRIHNILVLRGLQFLNRLRLLSHVLLLIGGGGGLQLRLHCQRPLACITPSVANHCAHSEPNWKKCENTLTEQKCRSGQE